MENCTKMRNCNNIQSLQVFLNLGSLLCALAIIILSVALCTDHWQEIDIDRPGLAALIENPHYADLRTDYNQEYIFYSRSRGIFRICLHDYDNYHHSDDGYSPPEGAFSCFWDDGLFLPVRRDWGWVNQERDHVLRIHIALIIISLLALLLTLVFWGCFAFGGSYRYLSWACNTGQLSAVTSTGSMSIFHVYLYLENKEILKPPFIAYWNQILALNAYLDWSYGYSYVLGWLASVLSLLAATMFIIVRCVLSCRNSESHKRRSISKESPRSSVSSIDESTILPPITIFPTHNGPKTSLPALDNDHKCPSTVSSVRREGPELPLDIYINHSFTSGNVVLEPNHARGKRSSSRCAVIEGVFRLPITGKEPRFHARN